MIGVGLSLGANTIMKIAGEKKQDFPLKAIVSVNNPFDIWCSINLLRGTVYEKHLCSELRRKMVMREQAKCSPTEWKVYSDMINKFGLDYEKLKKLDNWRDFDEEFTLKVHP